MQTEGSDSGHPKASEVKRRNTAILLFLLLIYALWVQTPRDWSSSYLDSIWGDVETRFKERQQHAHSSELNGFLDPHFRTYWGREGHEYQAGAKVEKSVESFRDLFSSLASGQVLDHRTVTSSQDSARQTVRADFEALLPSLRVALAKPHFVVPQSGISADQTSANLQAFRALALALSGYCELLCAEGKVDESLAQLRLIFELGDKLVDLEESLPTMTGASIHSIGLQTINGLFGPQSQLSATQWKELANFLLTQHPTDYQTAPHCLQRDYYILSQSLETTESRDHVPLAVRYVPGLFWREKRITGNVIGDILGKVGFKHSIYSLEFNWPSYLFGDVGFHSSSVLEDVFRVPKNLDTIEARILGYSLCCGLLDYRKEKGAFPESLEDLKAYGMDLPYYLHSANYEHKDGGVELTLFVWSPDSVLLEQGPFFKNKEGWAQVVDGKLVFRL